MKASGQLYLRFTTTALACSRILWLEYLLLVARVGLASEAIFNLHRRLRMQLQKRPPLAPAALNSLAVV